MMAIFEGKKKKKKIMINDHTQHKLIIDILLLTAALLTKNSIQTNNNNHNDKCIVLPIIFIYSVWSLSCVLFDNYDCDSGFVIWLSRHQSKFLKK